MSSDSALIASLRNLANIHGMAALDDAVDALRAERASVFSSPRIRNHAEQWVHTLMDLRSERKKEPWYSSSGWLMHLGHQARKEGLAPYLPVTRSRENPNAPQTADQQTWNWFVFGIMCMFEISSFREAATKAKHYWAHTPLDIHPHNLFVSLPRERKKVETAPPASEIPSPPAALNLSPIRIPLPTPKKRRSPAQVAWSNYVLAVQKSLQIESFREACHMAKSIIHDYQKKMNNQITYEMAREKIYSMYSVNTPSA